MSERLGLSELSMSLKPDFKLPAEISDLEDRKMFTPGFDVVKLPNVDPVGGMLGGYLDL